MISILIVENNALFRKSLKDILEMYLPILNVEEAEHGEEALEKIALNVPDIVFMDIQLPGRSGIDVTREIKAKYPQVIVTVLTAYDMPEYLEAATKHGADHFLVKGAFTGSEVATLIETVISHKAPDL